MERNRPSIHEQIQEARHTAIRDALSKGINNDRILTEIGNDAEKKFTDNLGSTSEKRFIEFTDKIKFVDYISKAYKLEDVFIGVDAWIIFNKSLCLPEIPVQIKSSSNGVSIFKDGNPKNDIKPSWAYRQFSGLMIVIDCGPSVEFSKFRLELWKQALEIREMIDKNHITADQYIKDSNSSKIR